MLKKADCVTSSSASKLFLMPICFTSGKLEAVKSYTCLRETVRMDDFQVGQDEQDSAVCVSICDGIRVDRYLTAMHESYRRALISFYSSTGVGALRSLISSIAVWHLTPGSETTRGIHQYQNVKSRSFWTISISEWPLTGSFGPGFLYSSWKELLEMISVLIKRIINASPSTIGEDHCSKPHFQDRQGPSRAGLLSGVLHAGRLCGTAPEVPTVSLHLTSLQPLLDVPAAPTPRPTAAAAGSRSGATDVILHTLSELSSSCCTGGICCTIRCLGQKVMKWLSP